MPAPAQPKIYHIVHVDKLPSITADGFLFSDAQMMQRPANGTVIGMNNIKARRLNELMLPSHPGLFVGQCVPFYFCPRSVMLFLIHRRNPELAYQGGQGPIVHLVADLNAVVAWAQQNGQRWAFTLSNAGSRFFDDRCDLAHLDDLNWAAIGTTQWAGSPTKEQKQAEFLIEQRFPWHLVEQIGVYNQVTAQQVANGIAGSLHRPDVHIRQTWYY